MRTQARINTWVPARTKSRIAAVAKRTGLKASDVIRIGLNLALDQFEDGPLEVPENRKPKPRKEKMNTS